MTMICSPILHLERLAVSPFEAAGLLSISKRTVARLLTRGKLRACRVGGRVLVDVASLKALLVDQPAVPVIKRDRVRSPRGCFARVRRKAAR